MLSTSKQPFTPFGDARRQIHPVVYYFLRYLVARAAGLTALESKRISADLARCSGHPVGRLPKLDSATTERVREEENRRMCTQGTQASDGKISGHATIFAVVSPLLEEQLSRENWSSQRMRSLAHLYG